jgi:hypothetical protein
MTQRTAQVDKLLTDVSERRPLTGLIADKILTPKKVVQYSGKIGNYGNSHLRLVNRIAGGENGYLRMDPVVRNSNTYQIETYGLKDVLTDEDYKNVENPYDAKVDSTDSLTDLMNLGGEYSLATNLTNTSVITNNVTLSGTDQWSDYDNSNPLADITTGLETLRIACGVKANKFAMDYSVWQKLKFHPKILTELGFNQNKIGGASIDQFAALFDIQEILVAECTYNNSKEGQADNMVPVWGKHFVILRSEAKAAKKQVTLGYKVMLTTGSKQIAVKPQDEPLNSDKIIAEDKYDQLITNVNCAYLIEDAIA